MIIVSQNGKSIYNFDDVKSIDMLRNEIYITDDILADEGACIGKYKTEDRAKEVLQEIIKKYEKIELGKYFKCPMVEKDGQKSFVYEMPKE